MGELRIGKVSAIDKAKWMVRVQFADVGITSGWLKVLKNTPSTYYEDEPKTIPRTDVEDRHYHKINFIPWFPEVGDNVLCIYNSGFNEDGYVVGGL